jgi:hypothetical protein
MAKSESWNVIPSAGCFCSSPLEGITYSAAAELTSNIGGSQATSVSTVTRLRMPRQRERHPTSATIATGAWSADATPYNGLPWPTSTASPPKLSLESRRSGSRRNYQKANRTNPRRSGVYESHSKRSPSVELRFSSNWRPATPSLERISRGLKSRRPTSAGGVTREGNRRAGICLEGAGLGGGNCWP